MKLLNGFNKKATLFLIVIVVLVQYTNANDDWLVTEIDQSVLVLLDDSQQTITINNGLISRTFVTKPNLACIGFQNLDSQEEFIRAVKPEAEAVINGVTYAIGGLLGQPNYAFLKPEWIKDLQNDPEAFQLVGYEVNPIKPRMKWTQKRYSADLPWPPKGKQLSFHFQAPQQIDTGLDKIKVIVNYAMYEGIPALSKWVTIQNDSKNEIKLDHLKTEILAVVERQSDVNFARTTRPRLTGNRIDPNDLKHRFSPRIHVQSDYAFCGMSVFSSDQTTYWTEDPDYATQVNYDRTWPHLLTLQYPYGPAVEIQAGDTFESFRTWELLHDSDEWERRGLAIRQLQRRVAPWVTENPIMLHLRYSDSESIRNAVDQCAEVGFEMIILSFGSGLNMESDDPEYLARLKADFAYAHEKGIEIGGYSLLSSRDVEDEFEVIDPHTNQPGAYFGHAPCLESEWGIDYFEKLKNFIEQTGCNILEHDGSYPGDVCASTDHIGHEGLADSQYKQHKRIAEFYQWCRERGVYLNVPDYYFLTGSNKSGMGYRETNWSLPREQQVIHSRQNVYDGTWTKTPSMGWMFVPLVEYHGGGAAATIEPLHEHLDTYEAFMAQNFGAGVQACYRGPRIYDTEETKEMVIKWVDFYKQNRAILDSDIIHVSRPDGRQLDVIMHVNPMLEDCGFVMIFNPTNETIEQEIELPLYYTGIETMASFIGDRDEKTQYQLNRDYSVVLPVSVEANGWTWFFIQIGDEQK